MGNPLPAGLIPPGIHSSLLFAAADTSSGFITRSQPQKDLIRDPFDVCFTEFLLPPGVLCLWGSFMIHLGFMSMQTC